MERTGIGIIGCGNISGIYLKNLTGVFANTRVVAVADTVAERAEAKAAEHPGVEACGVEELLAREDVSIVLNLTIPQAHGPVCRSALEAGKSTHVEKPLAVTREEGAALVALARERGLRLGAAPDTFLGAGIQTSRQLLDAGAIGTPVACTAFMMCGGHETWHPDPAFYYKAGGGPLFDMGPYYITALVALLGPVAHVSAATRISFPERTISSQPKAGTRIAVEVPTHVAGVLEFASGAVGTLVMSFDVRGGHGHAPLELYGSEGSLLVPDPNGFGGEVKLRKAGTREWAVMPHTCGFPANGRGIAVADMAAALRSGRPHRASEALAYHVLDVMTALHEAGEQHARVAVGSTCERPAPLPPGLAEGEVDP